MIKDKKILALIPARGGSKGIKDKNILEINNKPLIVYSIEQAKESEYIDDVVVTTDSKKIADVALQYGARVPFIRPIEFASDKSTTLEVVLHALGELKEENFEVLILLQPTSPLRTKEDIDKAIEKFMENDCKSLVSISEVDDSPILMRTVDEAGKMEKFISQGSTVRRQDMPKMYHVNGSIYINQIREIDENTSFNDNLIPFIMKKSHSVDIDEYVDVAKMKFYLDEN